MELVDRTESGPSRTPRVLFIYMAVLGAVAVAAVVAAILRGGSISLDHAPMAALLLGLMTLAGRRPLPFGTHARLYLDTAVVLAAVLLLPPGLALLIAGIGWLAANLPHHTEWIEATFNGVQGVLLAASAAAVLTVTGLWHRDHPFAHPGFLAGIILAGLAMHVVNTVTLAGILAISGKENVVSAWLRVAWPDAVDGLGFVAQWGLALLAAVIADARPWALILLVIPGLLVLGALDRHARLRVRAEARIIHQAFHDPLTSLPNRARLTQRLDDAFAARSRPGIVLLFLDLDRFKLVNDTMGHEVGDQLLVVVAKRLRVCVRPSDLVARLGGDEFVILLEGSLRAGVKLADEIVAALAAPMQLAGQEVTVSASVGIAHARGAGQSASDLLREADIALYRAKLDGRNRSATYTPAMGDAIRLQATLEAGLRHALEHGEFRLHYQPQVELETGQPLAFEALVRWNHPELGLVQPGDFLAVAEESGLIIGMGEWVLGEACRAAASWGRELAYPPAVAVNVGGRELADPRLGERVAFALAESGLPPAQLRLEISEGVAMADPDAAIRAMTQLAALGVGLVLDDVGTGRTSLLHLSRFPVEMVALDRTLIDPSVSAVVRAVVGLARGLGLRVAAKGIETAAHGERVRALGCAIGQGFVYGLPVPESEAAAHLALDCRDALPPALHQIWPDMSGRETSIHLDIVHATMRNDVPPGTLTGSL